MHEQRQTKTRDSKDVPEGAVPAYLLDREGQSRAKVLSNMVKQKRKEKAVSTSLETLIKIIDIKEKADKSEQMVSQYFLSSTH